MYNQNQKPINKTFISSSAAMHRCILFFIVSFSFNWSVAQLPYHIQYSTKEGLPSSEVHQVLQSKKGYMWFATDRGISKFDGIQFYNYTNENGLANNAVFYITEDHRGRIWYFTINNEIGYYEDNQWFIHPLSDTLGTLDYFSLFNDMYVDQHDTIWLGLKKATNTNIGALKISPDNKIIPIEVEIKKGIYNSFTFKVANNHVINSNVTKGAYNSYRAVIYDRNQKLNEKTFDTSVILTSNASISKEGLITVFIGNQVVRYNGQFERYLLEEDVLGNKIHEDEHYLWLSMSINGLWKIKKKDNVRLDTSSIEKQLAGKKVDCIFQDREGGFWITTLNSGIYYFPESNIVSFEHKNIAVTLTAENDTIWSGYQNGEIHKIVLQDQTFKEHLDEKKPGSIQVIYKIKNGPLLIGYSSNIYTSNLIKQGNALNGCFSIAFESEKSDSLNYLIQGKRLFSFKNLKADSIAYFPYRSWLSGYTDHTGKVWIGGMDGLFYYQRPNAIPLKHDFLQNRINEIGYWQNKLALASMDNGLLLMNTDSTEIIHKIGTSHGLSSNIAHTMAVESDSVIWVGTNNGLNKITYTNRNYTIETFDESNGLVSKKINHLKIHNGNLWIASDLGVSTFTLNKSLINHTPPAFHIKSVVVNSVSYPSDSLPEFDYKSNSFQVNYIGLSYKSSKNNRYSYRIKEIDTNWIMTTNRSVQLSLITHGDYTFEIRASNNNNVWSDIKSVQISIAPPFWRTWYFYLILILAISLFTYYLIRSKINSINRDARQKEEKLRIDSKIELTQKQLEKEKLEKQLVKNEFDFKKREMISYSLQLNRKNELLHNLKEEIETVNKKIDSGLLKGIKQLIHENLNLDKDWESFEIHFNEVHPNFFEKLKNTYPSLSAGELKYCAYFKVQLSNKEIARLINVTPKAVHIAKYRIKKKMDLTKEENLMEFLLSFE